MEILLILALTGGGFWFWKIKNDVKSDTKDSYSSKTVSSADSKVDMKVDMKKDNTVSTKPHTTAPVNIVPPPVSTVDDTKKNVERNGYRWSDYACLITTVMAIISAAMTLQTTKYSTLAVMNQGKETNTWAQYQAKGVKEQSYQISKAALELQLEAIPKDMPEAAEKFRKTIKKYDDEIKRYKDEKDDIMQQAEGISKTKIKAYKMSSGFIYSLGFLQISIILSSIAIVARKKYIWYVSMAPILGWIYFFVNSF